MCRVVIVMVGRLALALPSGLLSTFERSLASGHWRDLGSLAVFHGASSRLPSARACACAACFLRADALSCAQRCSYLRTRSACTRRAACLPAHAHTPRTHQSGGYQSAVLRSLLRSVDAHAAAVAAAHARGLELLAQVGNLLGGVRGEVRPRLRIHLPRTCWPMFISAALQQGWQASDATCAAVGGACASSPQHAARESSRVRPHWRRAAGGARHPPRAAP